MAYTHFNKFVYYIVDTITINNKLFNISYVISTVIFVLLLLPLIYVF